VFGVYGAMMSEAQLFVGSGDGVMRDANRAMRRRGDSDLDWGDTSGGDDDDEEEFVSFADAQKPGKGKQRAEEEEEEVDGAEGMEVAELDVGAMERFVGGLLGGDAGRFVTADDIRDGERMRAEDEDLELRGLGSGSSEDDEEEDGEVEDVFNAEEGMLISEAAAVGDDLEGDEDDSDEDDEDEERTPRTSFQARLERLRERARGKRPADASFDDGGPSSGDDEDVLDRNMTWAAEEEDDLIEELQVSFFRLVYLVR
jgi:hypothetical protein